MCVAASLSACWPKRLCACRCGAGWEPVEPAHCIPSRRQLLATAPLLGLASLGGTVAPASASETAAPAPSSVQERVMSGHTASSSHGAAPPDYFSAGPFEVRRLPKLEHTASSVFPSCVGNRCMLRISVLYPKPKGAAGEQLHHWQVLMPAQRGQQPASHPLSLQERGRPSRSRSSRAASSSRQRAMPATRSTSRPTATWPSCTTSVRGLCVLPDAEPASRTATLARRLESDALPRAAQWRALSSRWTISRASG